MKKILTLISIAALAAGCEADFVPEQQSTSVVSPSDVTIKTSNVGDNSFSFTMSTEGEAAYYSYLVDESEAPPTESLDPPPLYHVGSSSVAPATVKWTSESPQATVTVEGLSPNTVYQVYAVVGSPTGVPSSIAAATVTTSDKVAPVLSDYEYADKSVTLTYSESISLVQGAGTSVTVKYYAINSDEILDGTAMSTVTGTVSVSGSQATVAFEGLPDGAYYTVDIPAGMFSDASGNKSAAVTSSLQLAYDPSQGYSLVTEGIYGQVTPVPFSLGTLESEAITDWESPVSVTPENKYEMLGANSSASGSTAVYASDGKTTTYTMTPNTDFGYLSSSVVFYLPEEPARGDRVTFNVAAETFEDIYGNTNAEWTASFVYSYGYTTADVIGTYNLSGDPAFIGDASLSSTMTIAESDNAENGNVMITVFAGYTCSPSIYGTFDVNTGTLTIPAMQKFYAKEDVEFQVSETESITMDVDLRLVLGVVSGGTLSPDSRNPIVFNMPQSGTLINSEDYIGILYTTGTGAQMQAVSWETAYYNVVARKGSSGGTISLQSTDKSNIMKKSFVR